MTRNRLFLGVALLAGALAGLPAVAADPAVNLLLEKARSLEGRGRLDLAAENWRQALLADPDQPDALAGLARFARQSGKTEEAEQLLARLRQAAPDHPALAEVRELKVLAQHQSRLEEAARLAQNQRYDAAMAIYREVFGDNPSPGGWSIAYYETLAATSGGWQPAVEGLERLSEKYPESDDYRLSLGRLYTYRPETRKKGLQRLATVSGPLVPQARQSWRQALIWSGPAAETIESMEAYLGRFKDDAEIAELRDKALAGRGKPAPAGGQDLELGYKALQAEQLDEAESRFRAAIEQSPNNPKALAGLGFVRMKQERFLSAVEFLAAAKAGAPSDTVIVEALDTARYWNQMQEGQKALAEGRASDAAAAYRQALELRPAEVEALRGLAGAEMKLGRPAEAVPSYEKLLALEPSNSELWRELINARYEAAGAGAALEAARAMPADVRERLDQDVAHVALMATVYHETNKVEHSKESLERAVRLAEAESLPIPSHLRMRLAGLRLAHGDAARAAEEFERVLEVESENLDAWEGALASLVAAGDTARAQALLQRVPDDVYFAGMKRPSFLHAAASLNRAAGRLDTAEGFLRKALEAYDDPNSKDALGVRLELAYLLRERGDAAAAEAQLRKLAEANPESPDVQKAWVGLLHATGRNEEAAAAIDRIPLAVSARLIGDADFVTTVAGVYSETGRRDEAMRMVEETLATLAAGERPVPADLELRYAWLLLDTRQDDPRLFGLLQEARGRQGLTGEQRQSFGEIWLIWSLREAETARQAGEVRRAASVLIAAARMFPNDPRVLRALAGALLEAGHPERAYVVYKSWGLKGAEPTDYAGAVGAAMAAADRDSVNAWLRQGLTKWPQDSELLTLAGRVAAERGDYKRAEAYWKAALDRMPQQGAGAAAGSDPFSDLGEALGVSQNGSEGDAGDDLGRLLLAEAGGFETDLGPAWSAPAAARPAAPLELFETAADYSIPAAPAAPAAARTARRRPAASPSARTSGPAAGWENLELPDLGSIDNQMAALVSEQQPRSQRQEIEDQIAAIEARNTPFLGVGGGTRGRNGREGFEKLSVQESDFRASAVLGNSVRFSIAARPTYLDAGTWDGQSDLRLGLLPAGSRFGDQTASGVAGDIELGSKSFGLKFGTTPSGFLVENLTYGLRFTPGGGPITAMFERAPVRDTLLSYAGVRDPVTNQVFGGVIADEFALRGDWGDALRGFYFKAGYQKITGEHVADNKRIEFTTGGYWRVLEREEGSLTMGLNITGLSYDKNLRYFTLGHGGYFSPQTYLLMNVPVRWQGEWERRFRYEIGGSFGSQYIKEDDSPFFPTLPELQGATGPYYSAMSQTGAHFSLDAKAGYQVAPNWVVGGFVNANNTRNYNSGAAGFFVDYLLKPRPLGADLGVPAVPDWTGQRPFNLP